MNGSPMSQKSQKRSLSRDNGKPIFVLSAISGGADRSSDLPVVPLTLLLMTDVETTEELPPVAGATIVYLGPVAPHWEIRGQFGEEKFIDDFRTRVNARLLLLPRHDPQFRRNRERVNRDAERELIRLEWDLGDEPTPSTPAAPVQAAPVEEAVVEEAVVEEAVVEEAVVEEAVAEEAATDEAVIEEAVAEEAEASTEE